MASALINVPAKAKRGDIIEIKTLMSHIMETGYRHMASGELIPRDIITGFTCRYQRRGDLSRRPVPGDRRQSFHHVLHDGDRERQVRVRMDRRQGIFRDRVRVDHGRMRLARAIAVALLAAWPRLPPPKFRKPTAAPATIHEARHQGDAGRGHRQSRHALGARRRRAYGRARPAPPARPAPTATAISAPA